MPVQPRSGDATSARSESGADPSNASTPAPTAASTPTSVPASVTRRLVLAVTVLAAVMDQLDTTVVNVAAPAIRADLGGGLSTIQWYSSAYTLPFAVLLITGGRLGDRFGRRRLFLLGALGFTALSVACALATAGWWLIAARVGQGAFGALLIPQGFGLIRSVFPPGGLSRAFAVFAPAMGLASIAGPTVAGALIGADVFGVGWRMIFLINGPIGVAVVVLAWRALPRDVLEPSPPLDLRAVSLLCAAAAAVIYPLVQGRAAGWPWWMLLLAGLGLVGFAAFTVYERRTRRSPLIAPGLLRNRSFVAALALALVFFGCLGGFLLVVNVWLQVARGFTPLRAGLLGIPMSVAIAGSAAVGGAVVARIGARRVLRAGMILAAAGMAALAITVRSVSVGTGWELTPAMALTGLGMGAVFGPLFGTALAAIDGPEVGSASGVLSSVQQFGSSLGVAAIGTVYFSVRPATSALELAATSCSALVLVAAGLTAALPREARRR